MPCVSPRERPKRARPFRPTTSSPLLERVAASVRSARGSQEGSGRRGFGSGPLTDADARRQHPRLRPQDSREYRDTDGQAGRPTSSDRARHCSQRDWLAIGSRELSPTPGSTKSRRHSCGPRLHRGAHRSAWTSSCDAGSKPRQRRDRLCRATDATGGAIADAQHASLAISEGATWVTGTPTLPGSDRMARAGNTWARLRAKSPSAADSTGRSCSTSRRWLPCTQPASRVELRAVHHVLHRAVGVRLTDVSVPTPVAWWTRQHAPPTSRRSVGPEA